MTFVERIRHGAPLRIGELATYLGYSREQVRKWIRAGVIKTVALEMSDQRIPVDEAARIGRILQIPGLSGPEHANIANIANTANSST